VGDDTGPIPHGTYGGWCVDEAYHLHAGQVYLYNGTPYTGTLLSTCDTNELALLPDHGGTPPVGPPPIVSLATWNQVNWILNNKAGYNFWDVQVAINQLVGGPAPDFTAYFLNDPNAVAALVNGAASATAAGWVVPCGGTIGVILYIPSPIPFDPSDPQYQLIILEVPCLCPTANCAVINAVQDVAITSVTLVGSGGCSSNYTFTATGLPTGLNMASDGTISGTPTVNGTFSYTVTITDSCGETGTINCSVTVKPPLKVDCATITTLSRA
jgi:hypothetical protein